MRRDRLNSVIEAARQFLFVVDRDGLDAPTFTEELAELELSLAELIAPDCAGCGTPILGREGVRKGVNGGEPALYHRTCWRDGERVGIR